MHDASSDARGTAQQTQSQSVSEETNVSFKIIRSQIDDRSVGFNEDPMLNIDIQVRK